MLLLFTLIVIILSLIISRSSALRPSIPYVRKFTIKPRMSVIDGNAIAKTIREELAAKVVTMKEELGIEPGLAVVLVGARRDSATYVRMKKKACTEVGVESYGIGNIAKRPCCVFVLTLCFMLFRFSRRR